MINPLTLKIAVGAGLIALASGFAGGYKLGRGAGISELSGKLEASREELNQCRNTVIDIEVKSAKLYSEQQKELSEVAKNANQKIQILESAIANSKSQSDSLRDKAKRIEDQYRKCAAAAKSSNDTAQAPYMLSDMLDRLDQAAGDIAEYADRVTIASETCVSAYGAIK